MISATLYSTVYFILVVILTVITTNRYTYAPTNIDDRTLLNKYLGYLLSLSIALFIGFRPRHRLFVDMNNYYENYYAFYYGRAHETYLDFENFAFENLMQWLGENLYDITVFFVIMSLLYFLCAYKAMTLLFKNHAILAFVVFLGAFSTFSYATNGLKAGVAASLFLCALGYWQDKPKAIIFLILSIGFHHSMIMPIAAYVVALFIKNPKYFFAFWLISFFIAAAHITSFQEWFAGMADEGGANYLNNLDGGWGGKSGFRIDFVFYSALPVIIGYLAIFKYNLRSITYSFLLNVYLLTNAIWMLCMYASFTNRIAYLSWLMYPIVTIYPFFCPTFMPGQAIWLKRVVWFQLLFTLFMNVIYYG